MSTEITMPKLSDTMTEGRLINWKKGIGDKVERGDIVAEVETDKANMELEAFVSGTLLETRVKPGDMAPVGKVIAIIGAEGEKLSPQPSEPLPLPPEPVTELPLETSTSKTERIKPLSDLEKAALKLRGSEQRVEEKASPLVRRLARERGIDLEKVQGSGPDGRILAEDLESFSVKKVVKSGGDNGGKRREPAEPSGEQQQAFMAESRPLSRMRVAIARTVAAAWKEIPQFTVRVAIDMHEAEEVRHELKDSGTAVTINDMVVKAAAMALQKYPMVNNSFSEERILINSDINIGLVVSLEDGLLVPVLRKCQDLSLKEIGNLSRELIELALSAKITEKEMNGGTFTISNMGMFGVLEFNALIYPPQGAILAVGAVCDEAVVKNGAVSPGRVMRVTLSADHRLMDGAYAARFLHELQRVLENPVSMLV